MPDRISPVGNQFKSRIKHGHGLRNARSRTYVIWGNMVQRTRNPNNNEWRNYGSRGIKVCARWLHFEHFLTDMGECPPCLTIERLDNDKGYEPGNCVWATTRVQGYHRRTNRYFCVCGIHGCLTELARHFGINPDSVRTRLRLGWDSESAFTLPVAQ